MMDILPVAAEMAARALVRAAFGSADEPYEALRKLVRDRLRRDPDVAPLVEDLEQEQLDPENEGRLRVALLDVMVMDEVFAGKVVTLVGQSMAGSEDVPQDGPPTSSPTTTPETPPGNSGPLRTDQEAKIPPGPVRGFPGLTVAATSPQTTAGSDFSIFVLVQNPFDVPITVHNVQTHIPIELLDVNRSIFLVVPHWWRLRVSGWSRLSQRVAARGDPSAHLTGGVHLFKRTVFGAPALLPGPTPWRVHNCRRPRRAARRWYTLLRCLVLSQGRQATRQTAVE